MSEQLVRIMLVEDNELDVRMFLESAASSKLKNSITVQKDGTQALDSLQQLPDSQLPDLILLDLNLPGISGQEILQEIKSDTRLKHIVVVILTSSDAEADISNAYQSQAAAYITKPVDTAGLLEVVRAIDSFYLTIVSLPHAV